MGVGGSPGVGRVLNGDGDRSASFVRDSVPGMFEAVADRRVDAERHPVPQPVVDHRRDEPPFRGMAVSFSIIDAMIRTS